MSLVDIPVSISTGMRIGAASAGVSMSADEFDAITDYDDSVNYELINGVLVVTPMSAYSERSPNDLLGHWLQKYKYEHSSGSRLIATVFEQYLHTQGNRRRADRVIWISRADNHPQPDIDVPTIVVEFVSPGKAAWRRDYVEKRDEYLEAGVVEYWVIDRFRRLLTVYSQKDGQPSEHVVPEAEIYRTELLPGFELPLAELLAAADKWNQTDQSRVD